jgi:hypothetical protein
LSFGSLTPQLNFLTKAPVLGSRMFFIAWTGTAMRG